MRQEGRSVGIRFHYSGSLHVSLVLKAAERKLLFRRMKVYRRLRHSNFIAIVHSWVDRCRLELVYICDLMTGGSLSWYLRPLYSHLAKIKAPKVKVVKGWCLQLLDAIQYYHEVTDEGAFLYLRGSQIMVNANTNELKLSEEGFLCDAISYCKNTYFGTS